MNELDEFPLEPRDEEPPRRVSPPPTWWWTAVALAVLAAGAGVYLVLSRRPVTAPVPRSAAPTAVAREATPPLGGEAASVIVPPLDQSDPVVRALVRALSDNPVVAAWLATDGLIRGFTVAVANIAGGIAPRKALSALRPPAPFRVQERRGRFFIEPRSYDRYTALADAVASIDPMGATKLYATLKPRIEEAFGELGFPDRRFDQVLEQAIVTLVHTPTPEGPIQVVPSTEGIGYLFADGGLERLSESQKALLRMGPRNARVIKAKLRDIALALGIPSIRLQPE